MAKRYKKLSKNRRKLKRRIAKNNEKLKNLKMKRQFRFYVGLVFLRQKGIMWQFVE